MTLTKSDLAKSVMEKVRFKNKKKQRQQFLFPELNCTFMSKRRSSELVKALFDILMTELEKGESIFLRGFGRFNVKFKWARKGRNPNTGKEIIIQSCRKVIFKRSHRLVERINSPGKDH